jgi:hypothetical protein
MGLDPITAAIVQFVVVTAISWVLKPKPPSQPSQPEAIQGILVNKASNNEPIPVVYGRRQVGISRVFVESSGSDNQYLYMAGVLCEGGGYGIESIDEIYINDKLVTWSGALDHGVVRTVDGADANYYKSESLISVQAFTGLDNQTVSSLLDESTSWDSDYKLSNVAYVAFKFKWNQDAFNSLPEIRVTLKGNKLYDPRLDSTKGGSGSHRENTASTWEYSNNSSLVLLDYLRNARYGKGLPTSAFETNYESFKDSADKAEIQVIPYVGGSTINLFETNAVVPTEDKVIDNVRELLNPMRAIFNYTQGKYFLIVEDADTSVFSLNTDNIIGGIKIYGEKKNTKYNRIIGTFVNPDKEWQSDTISFPPYDDSALPSADQHATLLAEDNGTLLEGNFDFKFITSPYQAEELCEIILKRSRNALSIELMATSQALNLTIGDIVDITYPTGGFSAKPFRVYGLSINTNNTVGLKLIEHQDNFYTWGSKAQAPTISDTVLPNPFNVSPPSSVTLDDQLIAYNDGTVIVALDIAIGASPDSFVDYYQVEYKKSSETDYQIHGQGTGLNQRVLNVIDQETYDVRVKAVNSLGVSSTYVTATRTIIGAIAPPSDVEDFSCNIVGNTAHLSWSPVSDLDLAFYAINYSTELSGATWNNSFPLVAKVSRPATSVSVPARVGSFLIKAVDKLGNYSSNETIVTTNISAIGNFNAVATQTENPDFTGVKSNIVLIEEGLTLDTVEQFDDNTTDNFDDITTRLFDSGTQGSNLFSTGTYAFSSVVDIGAIQTSRVTASITQTATDTDRIFDFVSGNFDDESSNFDGDASVQSDSHLEIAVSDDNVTYTSFKNFNVGDYRGRFYKFRLFMTSKNNSASGIVSALSVTVDMEDRIFSGNDIVSGTGTYSVTFTLPFYSANYAVGITAQSLATGDYFLLTNKTINGFDVAFKNSSGTGISKTFDYISKGY